MVHFVVYRNATYAISDPAILVILENLTDYSRLGEVYYDLTNESPDTVYLIASQLTRSSAAGVGSKSGCNLACIIGLSVLGVAVAGVSLFVAFIYGRRWWRRYQIRRAQTPQAKKERREQRRKDTTKYEPYGEDNNNKWFMKRIDWSKLNLQPGTVPTEEEQNYIPHTTTQLPAVHNPYGDDDRGEGGNFASSRRSSNFEPTYVFADDDDISPSRDQEDHAPDTSIRVTTQWWEATSADDRPVLIPPWYKQARTISPQPATSTHAAAAAPHTMTLADVESMDEYQSISPPSWEADIPSPPPDDADDLVWVDVHSRSATHSEVSIESDGDDEDELGKRKSPPGLIDGLAARVSPVLSSSSHGSFTSILVRNAPPMKPPVRNQPPLKPPTPTRHHTSRWFSRTTSPVSDRSSSAVVNVAPASHPHPPAHKQPTVPPRKSVWATSSRSSATSVSSREHSLGRPPITSSGVKAQPQVPRRAQQPSPPPKPQPAVPRRAVLPSGIHQLHTVVTVHPAAAAPPPAVQRMSTSQFRPPTQAQPVQPSFAIDMDKFVAFDVDDDFDDSDHSSTSTNVVSMEEVFYMDEDL